MPRRTTNAAAATASGAKVGYENQLWKMADALRGNMDPGEYKHVCLGLLFLKYISDAFEEYHAGRGESDSGDYADVLGFCKSATYAELLKHGIVLIPGRYIGAQELKDEGDTFEEKRPRRTTLLEEQLAEGIRPYGEVRANMADLGHPTGSSP